MRLPGCVLRGVPVALLGGLAACGTENASAGDQASAEDAGEPPLNVLLFVIDTLRADRLSCYGHERETSPVLDRLAGEGVLFERAYAPSPYTSSSHASLFTSTYPATHQIWNKVDEREVKAFSSPPLSARAVSLAEVLRDAGYDTAAISDGGFLTELREHPGGFDQGFDLYEAASYGARDRIARAREWLEGERDRDRPFFLFLHTYEVHTPPAPEREVLARFDPGDYQGRLREAVHEARAWMAKRPKMKFPKIQRLFFRDIIRDPEITGEEKDFIRLLYDADIALTDEVFGTLLDDLERLGLAGNTVVIVTSDHGEQLWDHGDFGHNDVWEELLHVPLIVRTPGGPRGLRRDDLVDLVDLMPSVLALLDLPVPPTAVGRDVRLDAGGDLGLAEPRVGHANYPREELAWRAGRHKSVFFVDEDTTRVFDLREDPREQADLSGSATGEEVLERARDGLEQWLHAASRHQEEFRLAPQATGSGRSAAELEEIEDLGYGD